MSCGCTSTNYDNNCSCDCANITLPIGAQGAQGATGATGLPGLDGSNGENGTDGLNGVVTTLNDMVASDLPNSGTTSEFLPVKRYTLDINNDLQSNGDSLSLFISLDIANSVPAPLGNISVSITLESIEIFGITDLLDYYHLYSIELDINRVDAPDAADNLLINSRVIGYNKDTLASSVVYMNVGVAKTIDYTNGLLKVYAEAISNNLVTCKQLKVNRFLV